MLSIQEKEYFDKVVSSIISDLDVCIPILPYDHDLLEGKNKEALGCAWSYDKKEVYQITIDEEFIKACYDQYLWENHQGGFPKAYPEELDETICHELAHIIYWRHGKKHTELTQSLYLNYKHRSVS